MFWHRVSTTRDKRAFTKWILDPLKANGFKRYHTVDAGRIVGDSVFQLVNMQKRGSGIYTFTVNLGIRPLYIPKEYFSLAPGQRISQFMDVREDRWWSYETELDTEQSFAEVFESIQEYLMPWFQEVSSTKGLIEQYETNKYQVAWSDNYRKILNLGIIYMRDGQLDKAYEFLTRAKELSVNSDHPVDQKVLAKCLVALQALEGGEAMIQLYFAESEAYTRQALGLTNWS